MAKADLGNKRICVACSTKFYDLERSPAICPKCGTEQPNEQPRLKRSGGNPVDEKRPKKLQVAAEETDLEVDVPEEGDEDVLEDAAEDEDADAIPEDIEVDSETDDRG